MNIHLHCLVLDGVYRNSTTVFHEVAAPTIEELQALLAKIITRIMRLLTKHGFLIEEQDRTYLAEGERDSALLPLQAASCTYRIALGPRAGQKVLSLQSLPSPDKPSTPDLCAKLHGFTLHAAVRWGADQRKELEHLCRYITRPAIANERLKRNRAGQVVLQLKSPYKDGTTHIVMEPLEFMERLAALVPRPRLHLIRFHGVLAPNAKLRSEIIPSPPETATEPACDHAQGAPARLSWARLLKRVFDIDIEHCPNCGGSLKIIAAIEDPPVIVKILSPSGPAHPRPATLPCAAIRFIPDNLRSRKPLANAADGAARSEFERAARSGTLRAPPTAAPPEPAEATSGFSSNRKTIDIPPVRRYCSGQKKRWFKIPIQRSLRHV